MMVQSGVTAAAAVDRERGIPGILNSQKILLSGSEKGGIELSQKPSEGK